MNVAPLESVLSSLESGARPKGGVSADSGEIPSLGGEHVNSDGGFDFTNIKRIPRSFFETMRGGRIAQADILVVKDGATTGKTSFVREDFPFGEAAVNEHVFCVRVDSAKASPAYVYHFLRSERGQKAIQLDFRGATVGGISREFATKTRIPLPPLAEQRRIAEVLDRAEALRAKRRAALAQLDSLTQSIFLDLFGDPGINPKDWPIKSLGELGDGKGSIVDGPFGSAINVKEDYIEDGEVPVIRTKNVRPFQFIFEDLKLISRTKFQRLERSSVIPGDIILTKVGTIGNVCFFPTNFDVGVLSTTGSCRIRPNEGIVRRVYLAHFLHSYRSEMMKLVVEGVQPFLNMSHIKSFKICVPPLNLQDNFARRISAVERVSVVQRTSITELDALFATLQHRAFNGELFSEKGRESLVVNLDV